jgi:hypothetical protein
MSTIAFKSQVSDLIRKVGLEAALQEVNQRYGENFNKGNAELQVLSEARQRLELLTGLLNDPRPWPIQEPAPKPNAKKEPRLKRVLERVEIEDDCPVCLSSRVRIFDQTPCGHFLCGRCSQRHFRKSSSCPLCRGEVDWLTRVRKAPK